MGENTKISWAHHSFGPWWGCSKVSPGCAKCYAEAFAKRTGHAVWGVDAPRRFFGDKHWAEPLRWNAAAEKAGERHRVFCASMADVFEDYRGPDMERVVEARARVFGLIAQTPALDWLLLTKRPENVMAMVPESWRRGFPTNVWMGTTCEDQRRAAERIPHLLLCPASVRWISAEPLLGPVDFTHLDADGAGSQTMCQINALTGRHTDMARPCRDVPRLDWIVVGGESGPGSRPFNVAWARDTVRQCRWAGVPVFCKQMGANVRTRNDDALTMPRDDDPPGWDLMPEQIVEHVHGFREDHQGAEVRIKLRDRAGADPAEWPEDLRVREFPHA